MNIHEILKEVQKNLHVPKNKKNAFGGFDYRNVEDILVAVKAKLPENTVVTLSDKMVMMGERYYIESTAKITLNNDKEISSIECQGYAREENERKKMDAPQLTGSSSTYARKYALGGLFLIDDNKDPDSTNTGDNKKTTPPPANPLIDVKKIYEELAHDLAFCESLESLQKIKESSKFLDGYKILKQKDETLFDQITKVGRKTKERLEEKNE